MKLYRQDLHPPLYMGPELTETQRTVCFQYSEACSLLSRSSDRHAEVTRQIDALWEERMILNETIDVGIKARELAERNIRMIEEQTGLTIIKEPTDA